MYSRFRFDGLEFGHIVGGDVALQLGRLGSRQFQKSSQEGGGRGDNAGYMHSGYLNTFFLLWKSNVIDIVLGTEKNSYVSLGHKMTNTTTIEDSKAGQKNVQIPKVLILIIVPIVYRYYK
jgi:hypothetical protein